MKHIITLFGALLFASAVLAQQTITKSFDAGKLRLALKSSDVEITKSSDGKVHFTLEHSYSNGFSYDLEKKGSTISLEEKGRYSGDGKWTIGVPDNTDIKLNTGSSDVSVASLDVDLKMNAGSGEFEGQQLKGSISMNSGSGDIDLDGFNGDFTANTGSGKIKAKEVQGQMRLNTGSGDMVLDQIEGELSANVGSGDIDVSNLKATGKSSFNSGSGDVSVTLSASPTANISLNSGSGDATLDFDGNKMVGTLIMQANKKGGKIVSPISFEEEEIIDQGNQKAVRKTATITNDNIKISIKTGSGTAELKK